MPIKERERIELRKFAVEIALQYNGRSPEMLDILKCAELIYTFLITNLEDFKMWKSILEGKVQKVKNE